VELGNANPDEIEEGFPELESRTETARFVCVSRLEWQEGRFSEKVRAQHFAQNNKRDARREQRRRRRYSKRDCDRTYAMLPE
jgi:hypothetical protein